MFPKTYIPVDNDDSIGELFHPRHKWIYVRRETYRVLALLFHLSLRIKTEAFAAEVSSCSRK
jgi:hypothetical protein